MEPIDKSAENYFVGSKFSKVDRSKNVSILISQLFSSGQKKEENELSELCFPQTNLLNCKLLLKKYDDFFGLHRIRKKKTGKLFANLIISEGWPFHAAIIYRVSLLCWTFLRTRPIISKFYRFYGVQISRPTGFEAE